MIFLKKLKRPSISPERPAAHPEVAAPQKRVARDLDKIVTDPQALQGKRLHPPSAGVPVPPHINHAALEHIDKILDELEEMRKMRDVARAHSPQEDQFYERFRKSSEQDMEDFVDESVSVLQLEAASGGEYCVQVRDAWAKLGSCMEEMMKPPYASGSNDVQDLAGIKKIKKALVAELSVVRQKIRLHRGILESIAPFSVAVRSGYAEGFEGLAHVAHLEAAMLRDHVLSVKANPLSEEQEGKIRSKIRRAAKNMTLDMNHPNFYPSGAKEERENVEILSRTVEKHILPKKSVKLQKIVAGHDFSTWGNIQNQGDVKVEAMKDRLNQAIRYAEILACEPNFKPFSTPDFLVRNNALLLRHAADLADAQSLVKVFVGEATKLLRNHLMPLEHLTVRLLNVTRKSVGDARGELTLILKEKSDDP
jgi:hypothetical protein